ncbi:uncharacterized protein [Watersipora subatra]|uniref:uncharacterized protein n=1 Tax=Watersipora subatra TaxID=2589382 RepID=UPI00355B9807
MSVQAYRRSLRHMNEDALRPFIKAELSDANNAVLNISTKIQQAANTGDSTGTDVSLEPEELKEFLEHTKPYNYTMLLIDEIFKTLKGVSHDEENELSEEISELCQTMAELHATVGTFRDTIIQSLQNKFSQLKSKAFSTFADCQKDIASSPTRTTKLETWISTLAKVDQEIIQVYEDLRRWSNGKLYGSTQQDMDKISQNVRSLTRRANQLLFAAEECNDEGANSEEEDSVAEQKSSIHTTPSVHNQSVKSAVSKTRALVEAMKRETSSKETDLLSCSSQDTHGGIALAKEFAQAIATSFAQSMELQRVPVPSLYVFNGDPLEYADWEMAFSAVDDKSGISEEEKMRHLQRSVAGPARKTIQRYFRLKSPNATKQARQALRGKFGDDFKICDAYKKELDSWPKIGGKDQNALTDYSEFLHQCLITMDDVPALCSLNDWSEIRKVVDKLPDWLVNQWKRKVTSYKRKHKVYPKLKDLTEFLQDEVEVNGTEVTTEGRGATAMVKPAINNKPKKSATLTVKSTEKTLTEKKTSSRPSHKFCYNCEMTNHMSVDCGHLRRKPHAEVIKLIKEKQLCFGCLRPGHLYKMCQNRAQCTKCSRRHPDCLHTEEKPEEKKKENIETVQACGKVQSTTDGFTSAMIVPVWVSHRNKPHQELLTYAMLDTQSSSTFMLDNLFDKLKCPATKTNLTITTLTSKKETTESLKISNLQVRGYRQSKKLNLPPTYTRQFIPFDKDHVPTRSKTTSWPHLQHVENELEELFECDAGLLIGYDCMSALAPIETIRAEGNVPYAVKTELGWSIVGTVDQRESADRLGISHRVIMKESEAGNQLAFECKTTIKEKNFSNEITKIMQTDFTDIKDHSKAISMEDRSFLQQLSKNIHQDSEDFVTMPLPFRERPTNLPDNQKMAEKRLHLLGKKLQSEPMFRQQYTEFMTNLLDQGHAEEVTTPGKKGECWFLPHFAVFHSKKPDKIRVVFDGSAKFRQQSINDHLLQGPDLLNGLLGVLLRFRAKKIAIMCDIEKMFHQFRVAEHDRDYFRFLWWDDKMETVKVYRMVVHLFGATSSPGCATFGLRYLAQKHQSTHPKAADFIQQSLYVDDGLISVSSEQEAKELIESARDLCKKGNIRLHKFVTNSSEVLETVPPSERSQNLQEATITTTTPTQPERALGVLWCVETDTFRFTMPVSKEMQTRREILSLIASIYDPLGFLAPFIITGKQILQELCRRKADWESKLPSDLTPMWHKWTRGLRDLSELRIVRSNMIEEDAAKSEIHCFSDASTTGYGACAYLRQITKEGEVKCSYLLGKARVAPLKMITIPRMELQAAVVATQLVSVLERELKDLLPANTATHYWCDSMIVLNYISNDAKKFKVYVANRIQQIRDVSTPTQWHHIASGNNPADHASRGSEVKDIIRHWINPPSFLQQSDIKIPTTKLEKTTDKLPEARCLSTSLKEIPGLLGMMERYSKWETLVNTFAVFIRVAIHKKKQKLTPLQLRKKAIRLIIKTAQSRLENRHLKQLDP